MMLAFFFDRCRVDSFSICVAKARQEALLLGFWLPTDIFIQLDVFESWLFLGWRSLKGGAA